jgi:hypothetical protein
MFDDQTQKAGPARAAVYSYDVDAGTATMAWQFLGTSVSPDMGSFRIESDGARVIGWGAETPLGPAFTEVTERGARLVDFGFRGSWNARSATYRAVKVPTTAFDLSVLWSAVGAQ